MRFSELFQSFSRRSKPSEQPRKRLTSTFRNRVFLRCREVFGETGLLAEFWTQIHSKLTYLHGVLALDDAHEASRISPPRDALSFLHQCSDEHFLDFVELVFRVDVAFRVAEREQLVDDFNEFLRADDLPYSLTRFVWSKGITNHFGQSRETTTLTGYPQVIRKDSELLHVNAIAPALAVLADSRFAAANQEFLDALKDYRHGNYGDCLTKSGSGFESVLKVICQERGWPYQPNDTAGPLLKSVITNAHLEPFLEQPLLLISESHGSSLDPAVTMTL